MKALPALVVSSLLVLAPVSCGGDGGDAPEQEEQLQELETPTEEVETPDEGGQGG